MSYLGQYFNVLKNVLAYIIAANDVNNEAGIKNNKKYFLPRVEINNCNVLIDGRNFYDQPINNLIKQYDEVRKVSTGKDDDYTTECWLRYSYFKDNYRLIAVDSSKQSYRCWSKSDSTSSISSNCWGR